MLMIIISKIKIITQVLLKYMKKIIKIKIYKKIEKYFNKNEEMIKQKLKNQDKFSKILLNNIK